MKSTVDNWPQPHQPQPTPDGDGIAQNLPPSTVPNPVQPDSAATPNPAPDSLEAARQAVAAAHQAATEQLPADTNAIEAATPPSNTPPANPHEASDSVQTFQLPTINNNPTPPNQPSVAGSTSDAPASLPPVTPGSLPGIQTFKRREESPRTARGESTSLPTGNNEQQHYHDTPQKPRFNNAQRPVFTPPPTSPAPPLFPAGEGVSLADAAPTTSPQTVFTPNESVPESAYSSVPNRAEPAAQPLTEPSPPVAPTNPTPQVDPYPPQPVEAANPVVSSTLPVADPQPQPETHPSPDTLPMNPPVDRSNPNTSPPIPEGTSLPIAPPSSPVPPPTPDPPAPTNTTVAPVQQTSPDAAGATFELPGPPTAAVPPPADHTQPVVATTAPIEKAKLKATQITDKLKKANFKPLISAAVIGIIAFTIFNSQVILGQVQYLTTPSGGVDAPIGDVNALAPAGEENKILIPRINVDIPVVYDVKTFDEAAVQKGLERGVVHYGTTALPGEIGNNVIVGHSSHNWWDSGKYKFAFILLDKMEAGDQIVLHYDGVRYVYEVESKVVVSPDDVSVLRQTDEPTLTLITCTPPGTSWQRLVVKARQISPDPTENKASAPQTDTTVESLPSDSGGGFFDFLGDLF
ncbi:MAG: sortase [Candidatus Saccharimonadales bacterium]